MVPHSPEKEAGVGRMAVGHRTVAARIVHQDTVDRRTRQEGDTAPE
jgi:hypothetical protein